jgi:large subunit ribosomal protein L23
MNELLRLVRRPHITEKATRLKEESGTLCFKVATGATKIDVRRAVERLFDVKVESVRIAKVAPKQKRTRGFLGHKPGWRKAYVRLKPGQKTIEYLEGA